MRGDLSGSVPERATCSLDEVPSLLLVRPLRDPVGRTRRLVGVLVVARDGGRDAKVARGFLVAGAVAGLLLKLAVGSRRLLVSVWGLLRLSVWGLLRLSVLALLGVAVLRLLTVLLGWLLVLLSVLLVLARGRSVISLTVAYCVYRCGESGNAPARVDM